MLQNFIYSFLIIATTVHSICASTYLTEEAANEGVRRGKSESFASSTGIINGDGVTPDEKYVWLKFNGVLIHPSLVLTSRHCIRQYSITNGSFWTTDNAGEAWQETASNETSPERRQELRKYASQLDLDNIYFPPDESVDLAIIRLKRPLTEIKILPLLLDQPKKNWSNGYFVSYAPIYALPDFNKILKEHTRHIAILDVKEESHPSVGKTFQAVLVSNWQLKGDPTDPQNREFIPQENMHRLKAFTQESDSGAAFIVAGPKENSIAGIHRGRGVDLDHNEVLTLIIPLYPYKEWIKGILDKERT